MKTLAWMAAGTLLAGMLRRIARTRKAPQRTARKPIEATVTLPAERREDAAADSIPLVTPAGDVNRPQVAMVPATSPLGGSTPLFQQHPVLILSRWPRCPSCGERDCPHDRAEWVADPEPRGYVDACHELRLLKLAWPAAEFKLVTATHSAVRRAQARFASFSTPPPPPPSGGDAATGRPPGKGDAPMQH